jgi:hypothetical protein
MLSTLDLYDLTHMAQIKATKFRSILFDLYEIEVTKIMLFWY